MIKSCSWASLAIVLLIGGLSFGQEEEEPNNGDPIPLPFTRSALKVMYKKGLLIRYARTVQNPGKRPVRTYVFNEVLDHNAKGYSIRTLTFNAAGTAIGKPAKPQAIPYRVESKTFRVAKKYKYERIRIGKKEYSAHRYSYSITLGGRPGWRTVWYSGKHRGLLLKTMTQPGGDLGKKAFTLVEILAIPGELGGPKIVGARQGNLPWSDAAIIKAWPKGGSVEFQVKISDSKKKTVTQRLLRTMMGRERSCYVVREQLWDEKDKQLGDAGRPRLWDTWLGKLRSAPKKLVKKKLDREIEAAGRKWPCKVYTLEGKQKVTWYLSKEIPGLTVRYVSEREGRKVDRTLTKVSLPIPAGIPTGGK